MQNDLISRQSLMAHFATSQALVNDRDVLYCNGVLDVIAQEPAVDAVPVVRCEHCKEAVECRLYGEHWGLPPEKGIFCKVWQTVVDKNGYCYQGARIDGGAEG